MTVAVSILLAAVVGGISFALLDSWQRRETPEPAPVAPRPEPRKWEPQRVVAPPTPSPNRAASAPPSPLWSGWAEREPHDR